MVDYPGLLDEGQHRSAIDGTWRLNRSGLPTQLVIESTALDDAGALARADQWREIHPIESSPGANDGIVLFVAVDPDGALPIAMAISAGEHALPHGGLTASDLNVIMDTIVRPQLAESQPARAIVYSLREMYYQFRYTPPPQPDRTNAQVVLGTGVTTIGSLVAILALWTLGARAATYRRWPAILTAGAISLVLFIAAVVARSGFGALAAIVVMTIAIAAAIAHDRTGLDDPGRQVRVPRPAASGTRPRGTTS